MVLRISISVFLLPLFSPGQINGYAKIVNISANTLTLSNVNQVYDSISIGDRMLIIQMQGATISNSTNSSAFGDLGSVNSAGLYEIVFVAGIGSGATTLTLTSSPVNTYDPGASLQLVTYPNFGNGYTVTTNVIALPWDGNVGGVVAFSTEGNLLLQNNISADFQGFRGGIKAGQDGGNCENNVWISTLGGNKYAGKGEGIYKVNNSEAAGKAMAVNGGGGGIVHNGGGGGGGNFTSGGNGYFGYAAAGYCSSTLSAAGNGGRSVPSNINRVFMGGGGGGGHENNGVGSSGGAGGGIIFLKADSIIVEGNCFPYIISANGQNAGAVGNDGAGGGGAGGTIVLQVEGFRVEGSCPLEITADGGHGGDVSNSSSHGSGGGGGQGAIYVSVADTFPNILFRTSPGQGGDANNSGNPRAANGSGSSNAGVNIGAGNSVLPVGIFSLSANLSNAQDALLQWGCGLNANVQDFEVINSVDGVEWIVVESSVFEDSGPKGHKYRSVHYRPAKGQNYYQVKLRSTQQVFLSNIVVLDVETDSTVGLYPNPADQFLILKCDNIMKDEPVIIQDVLGTSLQLSIRQLSQGMYKLDVSNLPAAAYCLKLRDHTIKFVVVH